MQTVVQIGAGSIGRGFLGQLWTEAGYEVVYVDMDEPLVSALNRSRSYPLRLVSGEGEERLTVAPVRAVLASDGEAVAGELAHCAFAATAVGARRMVSVGRDLIAAGLVARAKARSGPLNVLLCENGAGVRQHLVEGIYAGLGDLARALAGRDVFSAVHTIVERMVPEVRPDASDDLLLVRAEAYRHLPVDASEWVGPTAVLERIDGLEPIVRPDRFHLHEYRKLFLHNGGHALLAYHGHLRGYADLRQCADDPELVAELRGFWSEVSAALARPLSDGAAAFGASELRVYTESLLERFRNPLLGDTVARVARDPARKLARDERLVGAAIFCLERGVEPEHAIRAIVSALGYDAFDDVGAHVLQRSVLEKGAVAALSEISGIAPDAPILDRVRRLLV